jgi:uncharacterized membrane protein
VTDTRRAWWCGLFACYALVALACSAQRPLWLDEVLQLIANSSHGVDDFMRSMGRNPGASPLGYLTQRPFVSAGATSPLWARFPSIIFSILSCWAVARICRELKMPQVSMLAAGLFMVMPLQFRYAVEGRPYSEALCFSLLAVLAFLKLSARPGLGAAFICVLAIVAALYTQPYAILNVAGVISWVAISNAKSESWKRAALGPACLLISLAAFLPWYLLGTRKWPSSIVEQGYPKFHWTLALLQDVTKGVSGDGFLCSAVLILLAAFGLVMRPGFRGLLLSAILFPICGALAGDAFMNYFFASRQILFALPGLVILAALGCLELYGKNRTAAILVGAVLLGPALQKDLTMQTQARENWPAAAKAVSEITRAGRCIEVAPRTTLALYSFFVPGLETKTCGASPIQMRAALISSGYTTTAELLAAADYFREHGFAPIQTSAVGGTSITLEDK